MAVLGGGLKDDLMDYVDNPARWHTSPLCATLTEVWNTGRTVLKSPNPHGPLCPIRSYLAYRTQTRTLLSCLYSSSSHRRLSLCRGRWPHIRFCQVLLMGGCWTSKQCSDQEQVQVTHDIVRSQSAWQKHSKSNRTQGGYHPVVVSSFT